MIIVTKQTFTWFPKWLLEQTKSFESWRDEPAAVSLMVGGVVVVGGGGGGRLEGMKFLKTINSDNTLNNLH